MLLFVNVPKLFASNYTHFLAHTRQQTTHSPGWHSLNGAALGLGPGLIDVDMREELAEDTMTVFMLFCWPKAAA